MAPSIFGADQIVITNSFDVNIFTAFFVAIGIASSFLAATIWICACCKVSKPKKKDEEGMPKEPITPSSPVSKHQSSLERSVERGSNGGSLGTTPSASPTPRAIALSVTRGDSQLVTLAAEAPPITLNTWNEQENIQYVPHAKRQFDPSVMPALALMSGSLETSLSLPSKAPSTLVSKTAIPSTVSQMSLSLEDPSTEYSTPNEGGTRKPKPKNANR